MPYLKQILEPLLSHPDSVEYTQINDEMGVLITIKVHKEDMGRVLGRQGMTIKAMRTLMHVWGAQNNAHISLKLDEPDGGRNYYKKYDPQLSTDKEISA